MYINITDVVGKYHIKFKDLENVLETNKLDYAKYDFFTGWNIEENHIDEVLALVNPELAAREKEKRKRAEEKEKEKEKEKKIKDEIKKIEDAKLANMLITSGFNFEGYSIVKYSGYISGDDAIEIARGTSGSIFQTSEAVNVKNAMMDSLAKIRRNALQELKEKAYDLGCNAVIGVDFDYINLDPETANIRGGTTYLPYIFGVTANGNAVIIKKDDE